jgi:hypothetical protein
VKIGKSFKDVSMEAMLESLISIKDNIEDLLTTLHNLGFYARTMQSRNAIIPLLYLIMKEALNLKTSKDKELVRYYMLSSFLKGKYGKSSDNVLNEIRNIINEHLNKKGKLERFDFKKDFLFNEKIGLKISDDDIENFMNLEYGNSKTLILLMFLCGYQKYNELHVDHLHAKKFFKSKKEFKKGINTTDDSFKEKKSIEKRNLIDKENKIRYKYPSKYHDVRNKYNQLANLSLLPGDENSTKNDKPLLDFLASVCQNDFNKHLIPPKTKLHLRYCKKFFEEREKLLIKQITRKLKRIIK